MQARLKIVAAVFLLAFVALTARLFYWQIIKGKVLSYQARGQYEADKELSAPRGNILAQDGSYLTARAEAYLVYAEIPKLTSSPKTIAEKLAHLFVEDIEDKEALLIEIDRIVSLLTKKDIVWIALKQKVSPEVKKNIEAMGLSGIGFERGETRIYPEASSAAQLLGFVGKDDQGEDKGYFGLEGYYDLSLTGKPGFIVREKDAKGIPILIGSSKEVSAISGVDLLTSIDKRIQLLVEERLKEGIEKYGAKAGSVIVMEPFTGAILAMSSQPSYDPLTYWKFSDELFKNPVVSDSFEPGSVFKILVMAAALDTNAVEPDSKCDACSGPLKVDKYLIETWDRKYYPDSTMTDIIVHSDNVGMAFVGQKLGADRLYDYLNKFGIGSLTGVDLQGEASPKLRDKGNWSIVDLATASFGQGVALTPIQMIKASSIIANGGYVITPHVVNKLEKDGWSQDVTPKTGEKVLSDEAVADIKAMMVEAAKYGESKWTYLRGFSVAGKTGTAQIPIAGHYDEEKTMASFVGFSPAQKPKFIMFVSLREPSSSPWASETAAPLWYSIAKDLFPYFGIQPQD
jgi:cell division protein FtsI (penicillin-binding protein 3)